MRVLICFLILSLRAATVPCKHHEVKVCTYNLWNIMFSWEVRLHYIANMVDSMGCEVLVLQEVRIHDDENWSQAQYLRRLLPRFRWVVFQAANPVSKPQSAFWHGWEKEGLAVLSQYPLGPAEIKHLSKGHGPDTNLRIILHVPVEVSSEVRLNVMAVHFSYDRQQQCQNAADILTYIGEHKLTNVIVAGDFNIYPDFPDPVQLFTHHLSDGGMTRDNKCQVAHGVVILSSQTFQDVWIAAKGANDPGFTFSNMPNTGLVSRPDRILVSSEFAIVQTSTHGYGTDYAHKRSTDILLHRLWIVLGTTKAAALGHSGYPCLQDCGPNGHCHCGVCVTKTSRTEGGILEKGDNIHQQNNGCLLPDCPECSSAIFLTVCVFVAVASVLLLLMGLAAMKILVVSAHFDQGTMFHVLGCTCCLCNPKLLTSSAFTTRSCIGRILWHLGVGRLPPFALLLLSFSLLGLCVLFALLTLENTLKIVTNIMAEEMFPSDHLMLAATLRVV